MQPIYKIFVSIEKRFQDEIVTDGGLKLYYDHTYKPEDNSTIVGVVEAIPAKHDLANFPDDFIFNVQVGDRLYFHFNIVHDMSNMIEVDGKQYWMVDYFDAIALVRDSQIHPVGSYVLIEPLEEKIESSLIIPEIVEREGCRGVVVASNEIPVGSEVEYEEVGKFWNVIEGRRLYCMFNSNILFIYDQATKEKH
jgi:co-chaperonin GroES (HSP10)